MYESKFTEGVNSTSQMKIIKSVCVCVCVSRLRLNSNGKIIVWSWKCDVLRTRILNSVCMRTDKILLHEKLEIIRQHSTNLKTLSSDARAPEDRRPAKIARRMHFILVCRAKM